MGIHTYNNDYHHNYHQSVLIYNVSNTKTILSRALAVAHVIDSISITILFCCLSTVTFSVNAAFNLVQAFVKVSHLYASMNKS